eukprot:363630-Chlamydomonas_euryale.AAC.4
MRRGGASAGRAVNPTLSTLDVLCSFAVCTSRPAIAASAPEACRDLDIVPSASATEGEVSRISSRDPVEDQLGTLA